MNISIVYGTRPELIKLAPVINLLSEDKAIDLDVICTGQHKDLLYPLQELFGIKNDHDWEIMGVNQSLNHISSTVLKKMDEYLDQRKTDLVIVQGDTSTVMAAAMAAYNRKVKVAHVEAGLRSYNLDHPFPEEFNRRVVSLFADYNFAPTEAAADNIRKEGVDESKIYVTGNTVIDAIHLLRAHLKSSDSQKKRILITAHRRENHGEGIANICNAVKRLLEERTDVEFVWPVHPNPNVHGVVHEILNGVEGVELVEPLDYVELLNEMEAAQLIWTDSGGIQEEAPSFKKPVLILREVTERPEVISSGFGKLVNHNIEKIVGESNRLLDDESYYNSFISGENPFGDGEAAKRIKEAILSNA